MRYAIGLLFLLLCIGLPAQETVPRITIGRIEADPALGNTGAPLVESIQSALRVTLTMANAGEIIQTDFLLPHASLRRARVYFEEESVARAVYGTIGRAETGELRIVLWVWSELSPEAPQRFEREVVSAFDVFDIADELGLEIASSIVGRRLAFGEIAVEGVAELGRYSVYVDGQRLAANQSRVQVLAGEREVIIAIPGALGEQPLQRFEVTVPENDAVTVTVTERPEEEAEEETTEVVPAREVGTLRVGSEPGDALVLLDSEPLGRTPLDFYGVPAGRYELELRRELFRGVVQVVEVEPRKTTEVVVDLEVDEEHPEVAAALVTPSRVTWAAIGGAAFRSAALLGTMPPTIDDYGVYLGSMLDMLVLGGMALPGHVYGRNDRENLVTSGIAAAGAAAGAALTWIFNYDYGIAGYGMFLMALNLYDLLGAAGAAERQNQRVLADVDARGALPPSTPASRRVTVEAGGGPVLSVGYRIPVVRDHLFAHPSCGLLLVPLEPIAFGASAGLSIEYVPLGRSSGSVRPFAAARAQGDYLLQQLGVSAGYEYGVALVLQTVDVTAFSRTLFALIGGGYSRRFGVGVRL